MSRIENFLNRYTIPDNTFGYFGDRGESRLQKVTHEQIRRRTNVLATAAGVLVLIGSLRPSMLSANQGIGSCEDGSRLVGPDASKDWILDSTCGSGDQEQEERERVRVIVVEVPGETIYVTVPVEVTPAPQDTPTPVFPILQEVTPVVNNNCVNNSCNTTNVYEQPRPYPTPDYPRSPYQQQQQGTNVNVVTGPVVTGPNTATSGSSSSVQVIPQFRGGFAQAPTDIPTPRREIPFITQTAVSTATSKATNTTEATGTTVPSPTATNQPPATVTWTPIPFRTQAPAATRG